MAKLHTTRFIGLIEKYNLHEKVIYHGPIPAKKAAAYFKGADALYVSLKGEGYVGCTIPNKLMMSMVYGKPKDTPDKILVSMV